MLSRGDRIIVGLSGGADSCAMLHFLCSLRDEYALELKAIHVNHMIRGEEARRDADFAREFCQKLCVAFELYTADVPAIAAEKGIGWEQCGREIRYGLFEKAAGEWNAKIATAHTLSDSVETVFFHMIRGCSLNGLKGIPPVRGNIIRPLILCQRSDIESYCAGHGIRYMTDSTNLSTDYARNKIRLRLLPLMRELNPSVVEAIGRLSESAGSDDAFLCELADEVAEAYFKTGDADRLIQSRRPVMSRALMAICREKLHICPEQRHIYEMMACIDRKEGSVNLPGDHLFLIRQNRIFFTDQSHLSQKASLFENWRADFQPGEIITPSGQTIILRIIDKNKYDELCEKEKTAGKDKKVFKNCIDYDIIKKAGFRFRSEGDRFSRAGRGVSKSLKKLFNEEKIPVEIRHLVPLLESDGMIAWICGIGAAEQFKVTGATRLVLYINADLRDITNQGGILND